MSLHDGSNKPFVAEVFAATQNIAVQFGQKALLNAALRKYDLLIWHLRDLLYIMHPHR